MNATMNRLIDIEYRYALDFVLFPLLVHRARREVIDLITGGSYLAMCSLYNKGWPGGKTNRFAPEDFKCRRIKYGKDTMLYITLPETDSRSPMASTHVVITYSDNLFSYNDIRVFNVERSINDTTAIGEMKFTPEGELQAHVNYGEASEDDDENINRIWKLAFHVPCP